MRFKAVLFALCGLFATAALAADFELADIDGNAVKLSDFRGKWVVVNYWATWCPPCREELPELVTFHDDHHERDAVVLGVNYEDVAVERLRGFVDDYLISYPVLPVDGKHGEPLGRIPGLPTTFLVSPDGEVVARRVGPVTQRGLEELIEQVSKEEKGS